LTSFENKIENFRGKASPFKIFYKKPLKYAKPSNPANQADANLPHMAKAINWYSIANHPTPWLRLSRPLSNL
jgi:hypothetical protein